ncbi:uncharacterized protein H6S33_000922 [Morchella sextelata]|uniref:uncharacterized protein n=1 Tax=Morchella sextelata TaxID=1174677 RepID=UPI001D057AF2|nr:uncharacterized protein H6S33_000922 [Morchella sextelata]KAH0615286.1 hypothetical protein H6S33_000922 [Morchella sextelata]
MRYTSEPQTTHNATTTFTNTISPHEAHRRQQAKALLDQITTALGPPITQFLASHGPTCTPGSEASFIIHALNYARSQWSVVAHGHLPLAAVMCVWSMKGKGLFHYYKDKLGMRGPLVYRCALCHEMKPGGLCSMLEHVGMVHASAAERGVRWERQAWPVVLPIRGLGEQWEVGEVKNGVGDRRKRRWKSRWDTPVPLEGKYDNEVIEDGREMEAYAEEPEVWEAAVKEESPELEDPEDQEANDDLDQDIYDLFAEAWE